MRPPDVVPRVARLLYFSAGEGALFARAAGGVGTEAAGDRLVLVIVAGGAALADGIRSTAADSADVRSEGTRGAH